MVAATQLARRRVLIVGLGLFGGGASAARWFAKRGARVTATDLRSHRVLAPTVKRLRGLPITFVLGRHRLSDVRQADLLIRNPAIPNGHSLLTAADTLSVPVEGDTGYSFSLSAAPIVGVTGSKGKSTTAALTTALLHAQFPRVRVGGNIGRPMLEQLGEAEPRQPWVLELSSWQLEALRSHRQSPHVAVLTNVLPDHLNRYPSFAAYTQAKYALMAFQRPGDVAIVNEDNVWSRRAPIADGVTRWTYSLRSRRAHAFVDGQAFWLTTTGRPGRFALCSDLRVPGEHFQSAVLAAALVASAHGVPPSRYRAAIRAFRGLPGRLETVRERRGVRYINDTCATAPVAVLAALRALPTPLVLIAGGVDKNLPYAELAAALPKRVRQLILLPGSGTEKLRRAVPRSVPMVFVSDMRTAVQTAAQAARAGDSVVLSPGAASFNLFLNEFDRGDQFKQAVEALAP